MRAVVFLLAVSVVPMLVGCGGPGAVPVSGTVTYNGEPVADAMVRFHPTGGGEYATASTDAQGSFDRVSSRDREGMVPGDYKVAVTVVRSRTEEELISYEPDPPPPFPGKFTDPSTSNLTVTIERGGPQTVELKMQD